MKEKLTKLRTNPIVLAIWVVLICGIYIFLWGANIKSQYSGRERLIWVILAIVLTLIIHELVHAFTASILCKCKIDISVRQSPMGFPSLVTSFPSDAKRWKKMVIYFMPILVLTIVPTIVLALGYEHILILFVAMLNLIGAYYDVFDICILLSEPKKNS